MRALPELVSSSGQSLQCFAHHQSEGNVVDFSDKIGRFNISCRFCNIILFVSFCRSCQAFCNGRKRLNPPKICLKRLAARLSMSVYTIRFVGHAHQGNDQSHAISRLDSPLAGLSFSQLPVGV